MILKGPSNKKRLDLNYQAFLGIIQGKKSSPASGLKTANSAVFPVAISKIALKGMTSLC